MSSAASSTVPLTVIISTAHPSETLDEVLAILLPQLAAVGGELILADGSVEGLPTPAHPGALVTQVRRAGADVFRLRVDAIAVASGRVVAVTEDHCVPATDWCRRILDAHANHDAAAVCGATVNGSPQRWIDRANFLMTFAAVLPPFPSTAGERVPPPNNVSFKRSAFDTYSLTPGFIELELTPHLVQTGSVAFDETIVVAHVQSHGFWETLGMHFHNGRSTTGLLAHPWRLRLTGIRQSLALVPRHLAHLYREVRQRPEQRRPALPAAPFCVALMTAHATGQIAGYLAGPGNSPGALD